MVELIEATRILISEFGLLGVVLPLGGYGYYKITKKQESMQVELNQVEQELMKTEIIEKEIQNDIKEIRESLSKLLDIIIDGRNK